MSAQNVKTRNDNFSLLKTLYRDIKRYTQKYCAVDNTIWDLDTAQSMELKDVKFVNLYDLGKFTIFVTNKQVRIIKDNKIILNINSVRQEFTKWSFDEHRSKSISIDSGNRNVIYLSTGHELYDTVIIYNNITEKIDTIYKDVMQFNNHMHYIQLIHDYYKETIINKNNNF